MEPLTIDLSGSYFEWLKNQILGVDADYVKTYHKLIKQLHNTLFLVCDPNDQPREDDAYDLRWRYEWDADLDYNADYIFVNHLPSERCSILEMMIALSMRVDENFTRDSESTTSFIFWSMVKSMGLFGETDDLYDENEVSRKLDIFNNRMYSPNGHGGLFTFPMNYPEDMRCMDIWNQLCCWLNENYR